MTAYPVILTPARTGYVVNVPDLNIGTQGRDLDEALDMARDAIELWGACELEDGRPIPAPSPREPAHRAEEAVAWVNVDLAPARQPAPRRERSLADGRAAALYGGG